MALRKENGEEWKEYDNAVRWMMITLLICVVLSVIFFIFALPASYLISHGVSKSSMDVVRKFLGLIAANPDHLFTMYGRWFRQLYNYNGSFSFGLWL